MENYATRYGKKKRKVYEYNEDMDILNYIAKNNLYMFVNGNECWKTMELKKITRHSASSMRTHFLKIIVKKLDSYDIPNELKDKYLAYANITFREESSSDSIISNSALLSKEYDADDIPYKLKTQTKLLISTPINDKKIRSFISTPDNLPNILMQKYNGHIIKQSRTKRLKTHHNRKELRYSDNEEYCNLGGLVSANPVTNSTNLTNSNIPVIKISPNKNNKNALYLKQFQRLHEVFQSSYSTTQSQNSPKDYMVNYVKNKNNMHKISDGLDLAHRIHLLLSPIKEVNHFLAPAQTSDPGSVNHSTLPTSPAPSTQFYTPSLELENGTLVANHHPRHVSSQVESSFLEDATVLDIFSVLNTYVVDRSDYRDPRQGSGATTRLGGGSSPDPGSGLGLCDPQQSPSHHIHTTPSPNNSSPQPKLIFRRSRRSNHPPSDGFTKLREFCEKEAITIQDIHQFLKQKGWLEDMAKIEGVLGSQKMKF